MLILNEVFWWKYPVKSNTNQVQIATYSLALWLVFWGSYWCIKASVTARANVTSWSDSKLGWWHILTVVGGR